MSFRKYLKTKLSEETSSGDIAPVTPKLDLIKRKCPKCLEEGNKGKCKHKVEEISEASNIEQALRSAKIKIKTVRDGKFGTEFDLFKVPDDLDTVLKDYKYQIKDKTLFVFK